MNHYVCGAHKLLVEHICMYNVDTVDLYLSCPHVGTMEHPGTVGVLSTEFSLVFSIHTALAKIPLRPFV